MPRKTDGIEFEMILPRNKTRFRPTTPAYQGADIFGLGFPLLCFLHNYILQPFYFLPSKPFTYGFVILDIEFFEFGFVAIQ